ncbi:phosphatidylserine decarboxylase family protein [Burkholderia glumae]|uniref:Phosphatidylserine decarboxylase family protein n=1 Tax=Burkholderia glumae TaxID=337 RepID=A0AAQ0BTC4_BURGL|nr:phosphatidylserine decarboxylase family protein [Burkholderia glumae]AJY63057.1 phosphatidylserine decarboxylase family protein [Burkholderia glumae LMG 2196 = ATCC 33617]KHJ61769.1 phosphatidylserine decarboxylase [Burkholderia glumae]MCM2484176.1 phosphatidylserine decarboxylase family protein [Burkholderia glumae]MCM2494518.1 phosphatidylserine decarboxylase family protein [Burkholderia glumae]MCM2509866.1 phosphatidylserine decarboxylase family protein [Burkholderia glumae]
MTAIQGPARATRRRLGDWLATEELRMTAYRRQLAQDAYATAGKRPRAAVVAELAALFERDAVLRMSLTRAIGEAGEAGYGLGYATIEDLMSILDHVMRYAPPFSEEGLIACPINALLDWPMCMPSGYPLFRDATVNAHLGRLLSGWCDFLSGPHSREHLHERGPTGWFCEAARERMRLDDFVCRRDEPCWGFDSWNHFFTRRFRDGARPVAEPNDPRVVVSACEAAPYQIAARVQRLDEFWIKSQPYSIRDMLTPQHVLLAERFVGGDIYQAYLSAYNYHRWHAPVGGTVTHAYRIPGTYFSGADVEGTDPSGLNDSQGYMTAVATRAVVVIDCEDPGMGTVACVFVGMGDVSSCVIDAHPGQRLAKGDEIGYFQYGGSTFCLLFEPDVIERFVVAGAPERDSPVVPVNAAIAVSR